MTERRQLLQYFGKRLARFPALVSQSIVIILMMSVVNLPLPLLNKITFDHLFPAGELAPIIIIGLLAFAVRALASVFQVFQNYVIRRVITSLGHDLRQSMVNGMLASPYQQFVTGAIMAYSGRMTADVTKIEHIIFDGMRFVIRPLGMIVLMLAVMLLINPEMTLILFLTAPVCIFAARRLQEGLKRSEEIVLEKRQQLQADVSETLDNVRVIRSFNKEQRYQQQIASTIDEFSEASISLAVRRQLMNNIVQSILLLPWIGLISIGSWMIHQGQLSLGDLMLFVTFEGLLRSPLGQLTFYLSKFNADLVAPERVREVNELPAENSGDAQADSCHGALSFEHLTFHYGNNKVVIDDFNLEVPAGSRVALVGTSGAGKTTLMNLLLGFYDYQHGQIRLDGIDIRQLDKTWYRQQIGMVFQDNPMFDGTVRSNLKLDQDFSDADMWQALEQAQAEDFVRSLPQGLDTRIGTRGLKLSGGQRQRLAIARVMLRDPKIVLLDEATSSLDSATELQIQKAMDRLLHGRTSITIAHRLSTIVASDVICYLEHGRVIEQGTHEELIKRKGAYFKLYETQVEGLL